MKRLLIISLAIGAASALVAWVSLISEFTIVRDAVNYLLGWYLFWGSLAACTGAAFVSAAAGWRFLSRPN
jgi:hypothetical protein